MKKNVGLIYFPCFFSFVSFFKIRDPEILMKDDK